jgi:hypothetical protein
MIARAGDAAIVAWRDGGVRTARVSLTQSNRR